ncbi:MAG: DUF389 domain-containing protein [Bryobacterales bacterium]|nr:DUF389 domain-containing protein [Bryobacterales bacterium]
MSIRHAISHALRIDEASKPLLYRQIYEASHVRSANYLLDLLFAAGIATFGLVLNSPAVVIGAMLISPLMGPILAAGLAFAASDIYLGIRSLISLTISIGASILFSALLVWMLPFQSPTSEILGRTQPNLLDLGVALFSGLAGSVVMARSLSGGAASALPGVAIAVALMPPLCTVGFGVGSGWNWQIITGAGLLFLTNLIAIAGSAFFVFYLVSMDDREVRSCITARELRRATGARVYALLRNAGMRRVFGDMGQLRWRIVMVAVTLAILFVPLRQSLNQLKDETVSRGAAREIVRGLMPADAVLSQQLELFSDRVLVHLVSTVRPDQNKLKSAEIELARRTGKSASIDVRRVADETELVNLRERLRAPAPPRAEPEKPTLESLAGAVRPMVEGQVKAVWPESAGELVAYEVGFAESGVLVRLKYRAARAVDAVAQEAVRNALRQSLTMPGLETAFEWERAGRRR